MLKQQCIAPDMPDINVSNLKRDVLSQAVLNFSIHDLQGLI